MNGPGLTRHLIGASAEQEARKLAGLEGRREDELAGVKMRQATIIAYDSGTGLATITLGGDSTPIVGVRSLGSYRPTVGDTGVWVLMVGTAPLLIGAVGAAASATPAGAILAYGSTTAPMGWLACDGAAVSRTTFADLFAVVGTDFGAGNGTTTFNVPDLADRFPMGGSGIGDTGGAVSDDIAVSTTHEHALNSDTSAALFTWVSGTPEARMLRKVTNGWNDNIIAETVAAGVSGVNTNTTGVQLGGSSANAGPVVEATIATIPPHQVVAYIIKH